VATQPALPKAVSTAVDKLRKGVAFLFGVAEKFG
jgi:hypothetical protein